MKIAFFDVHKFEKNYYSQNQSKHSFTFFETMLNSQTASLANGFDGVCCFVNDRIDRPTISFLKLGGVKLIALRSAGFNNVDIEAAEKFGIPVVRVPAYSPYAVAEYAVGLLLSLNRKIHRAFMRVREWNFSLEGLVGMDLHGKTVGVIGTGRIGSIFARIMKGFGCNIVAFDTNPSEILIQDKIVTYGNINDLYKNSDIISLHVPLLPETRHIINFTSLAQIKKGALIVNTGRGALIDSQSILNSLKAGHLGGAALDVYEEEEGIFFKDLSDQILQDDVLARLLTFPNVLITSHQAFLTHEALTKIAATTMQNMTDFEEGTVLGNQVHVLTHLRDAK